MRIPLRDITEHGLELEFSEKEPWVIQSIEKLDEDSETESTSASIRASLNANPPKSIPAHAPRNAKIGFELRKVDDVVLVQGRIQTSVRLNCSRCVISFPYVCEGRFTALYSRDPEMSGLNELKQKQTSGMAKSSHDAETAGPDLEITYLAQDYIDLAEILAEQLMLQVPYQPLCKSACKGLCQTCGTDLNLGRCACEKVAKQTPFSVLKDFQLKSR